MKSKIIVASLLAILMVVTVMPMNWSEDSDALTGNSNISLNAQHVNLYTDSPTQSSFVFTVDLTNSTSQSTTVTWTTNAIGTPQATVQLSATTGNSITVTGTGAGTIEIVATVDSENYASAVVAVQTGYAPATSFTFKIQVDESVSSYYANSIIVPSNVDIVDLNDGISMTVTKAQVEARYGAGTTFNALNAFKCAMAAQNEIIDQTVTDPSQRVYWDYSISDYGWFNTFLGLGSYMGDAVYEDGNYIGNYWIYWAQYHAVQNGTTTEWAFNNYGFYDIETDEYATIGMFFWASPPTMDVPDYPFIVVPTP
jgi:hypothetical protein